MQSKADNPLRSLRILMIVHLPWERNLGGSRVQVELADEFRRLGHVVEKFDYTDAFPRQPTTRIGKLLPRDFSRHAKAFVRANAARFDVIEANQTDLPFSKRELGFDGLLVARSAGLKPMYAEFLEQARRRWPTQKKGHPIAEIVREWNNRRHLRLVEPSLRAADLIIVPNRDELSYISGVYGIGVKCVRMPFGLSVAQHETFARTADYPAVRLTSKQVAFIGSWDCRKGSEDWPSIVRAVLARVPDAKFLFVGTGRSREWILGYLGHELGEKVEVISKYVNTDLPMLLSGATVGAFPSYIEGFGFAVLEKLASGIPTIAYDAPGAREMLKDALPSLMVPCGDIAKFANRIVDVLMMDETAYERLSMTCQRVAGGFEWGAIARQTIHIYEDALNCMEVGVATGNVARQQAPVRSENPYADKGAGYFAAIRYDLIRLIPQCADARVLEVGAGGGYTLLEVKRMGLAKEVMGIDLREIPGSAQLHPDIDRFVVADIENMALDVPEEYFDVILCADVLEHLVDPWVTVAKLTTYLKMGGVLISSIPNVRNYRVLGNILFKGTFSYEDAGILDRTHLRFFCRKNIAGLFEGCGYDVVAMQYNMGGNWWPLRLFNAVTFGVLNDLFVFQYCTVAKKRRLGKIKDE